MGRSTFKGVLPYREDPPAFFGQTGLRRSAREEIGESPLEAHSIRTTGGHRISTDTHLPSSPNLLGLSHDVDDELLAEIEPLTQDVPQAHFRPDAIEDHGIGNTD